MNKYRITYAQNKEDILLSSFFDPDEIGFYVDVGAEAPTDLSVTKIFYDRGWRGINVEPIVEQYKLFVDERPRDINLNIGISNKAGTLKFRQYEGQGYSTFSDDMKDQYEGTSVNSLKKYKDYEVKVLTLKEIFEQNKVTGIQFLKVDVEGLEYEVLEGNNWKKYRPEVICIEANHVKRDWRKLLKENDYKLVFFDGLNEYYTDKNTNRDEKFNYVDSVIFHEPLIEARVYKDLERYEKNIDWLETTIDTLREENAELTLKVQDIQVRLEEIASLKRHAKKVTRFHLSQIDNRITTKLSKQEKYIPFSEPLDVNGKTGAQLIESANTYDQNNYQKYNQRVKPSLLLPVYRGSRGATVKTLRKVKKMRG